jgi:hypothetical protein
MCPCLHKLAVLADIQVNILINCHSLQPFRIISEIDQLLDLLLAVMWSKVSLVLSQDFWLGFLSPQFMSQWRLNNNLLENSSVIQNDRQGIGDGAHIFVMVILCELWVLNALDLLAKGFDKRRCSGFSSISVVGGFETAINEHDGAHVLDAMVTVSEVVHGLELFVNDSDTSFVCAAGDILDIGS